MVCTRSWGKSLTQEAYPIRHFTDLRPLKELKVKEMGGGDMICYPLTWWSWPHLQAQMSRESGCSMFSSVYIQISPFFNLSPAFFLLCIRDLLEVRNELFLEFFCFCIKFPSLLFSVFKTQLQENDCIFKHCHWGPLIFTFCIKLVINPPGFIIFSLISTLGAQQ